MSEFGRHSYTLSDLGPTEAGEFVSIAGGCIFHHDDNHACIENPRYVSTYPFHEKFDIGNYGQSSGKGKTIIGNDVWIGEGVRIMSGVHIGNGVIIGAGSVVTKDVPSYAIAAGNPARVVRFRFTPEQIEKLEKIKWWSWDDKTIRENIGDMMDIDHFLEKFA